MTFTFAALLLALFGLSLILITLALWLLRGTSPADEKIPTLARFFLIALRLAIGWHCFVEGMEKLSTPGWSSEGYLRESMGPFSGMFRAVAGDRLVAKATLGPDESFPAELEREWQAYFDAFAAYYDLDDAQLKDARRIFDQRKSDTLMYLRSKSEIVTTVSAHPPDLNIEMNMKQRLAEHERLLARVHAAEAKFPSTDKDVHAEWKSAKADLAKWRAGLKRSIDAQTEKLKKIDESLKKDLEKKIEALKAKLSDTTDADKIAKLRKEIDDLAAKKVDEKLKAETQKKIAGLKAKLSEWTDPDKIAKLKNDIAEESAKLWSPLGDVLRSDQRLLGAMPEPKGRPLTSWRTLEWADASVKWGLVLLGGCLMLGLMSRTSSGLTALLILSFYLAMPALPGWPEPPRLEGHYVLVNKTLIEVIALLVLASIPTGRWAGLDGFCYLLCCGKSDETKSDGE